MRYALLLKPHANVRYQQSLQKLALIELRAMLRAWGMGEASATVQELCGEPFLTFEADALSPRAWRDISGHSAVCLAAEARADGTLRLLERRREAAMPDDLPQVLKYKGKTNADFTYFLLHCAKAASDFAQEEGPLRVLDPMCGKATTLFCALCEGCNATGIDTDAKALQEACVYLERSLKLHHIKHKREESSRTLGGGGSARCVSFEMARDAQAFKAGDRLRMEALYGDAARTPEMVKAGGFHLVVSDLPYGVQHAPRENGGMSSLARLVERVAPGCERALKPGGALAFSFNQNTLRRSDVARALTGAGLDVLAQPPFDDFSHWVEQAVERDVVIARKPGKQAIDQQCDKI